MSTSRDEFSTARPLEALGIGADEERIYRFLLQASTATRQDVVRGLDLQPRKAQALLNVMEGKGLATRSQERPCKYIPTAPDVAIHMLALRHEQAVQRAQGVIHELQHLAVGRPEQVIELITSPDLGKEVCEQVLRSAQHELVVLVRLPVLYSRSGPTNVYKDVKDQMQAKKVRVRTIYDAEYLSSPGTIEQARIDIAMGEDAKVFPSLPFKLLLVDHRTALIPLIPNKSDSPSLLIRYSALLDALYSLFEILWQRAVPLSFTRAGSPRTGSPPARLSDEAKELAWLMASGLNDKTAADHLHISLRTFERRIAELMQSLDTRTRFQAGWAAALYLSGADGSQPNVESRRKADRDLHRK